LGIPFDGVPGPLNAITDVAGIEVGQVTLISGDGPHAVRTGVTAVFPLGKNIDVAVPAASSSLNGNGEMTGTAWMSESGFLEGPIVLTNTFSVGTARDAVVEWGTKNFPASEHFSLPVVAETYDARLNDIAGFHVSRTDVMKALDQARPGPVEEGNVGGGTGMVAFQFKGGIGSASRRVTALGQTFNLGVLVQANFGLREQLVIAGVPVGSLLTDLMPKLKPDRKDGSIIVILATDAPLLPSQIKRLVRRATVGVARTGGIGMNSSGDLFVGFSTRYPRVGKDVLEKWSALPNSEMDGLFAAAAQATEEAIINTLIAAETMVGVDGNTVYAIPRERVKDLIAGYNRSRHLQTG
jgi:L-aminopeptidase/D-esterase-like protein